MQNNNSIHNIARAALLLLALLLSATMAWADDVPNFNVTLLPGVGTGDAIVLNSRDNYYGTANSGSDVPRGQFWMEGTQLWFKVPDCPDTFTPPEGKHFDNWAPATPGMSMPITGNETLTAQWRGDGDAYVAMTTEVTVGDFDADGYAPVTVEVTSLDFGQNHDEYDAHLEIQFLAHDFQGEDRTISYMVSNDHGTPNSYVYHFFRHPESFTFYVYIDPADLAAAPPGTYTGEMSVEFTWEGVSGVYRPPGSDFTITLTLNIPHPALSLTDDADNTTAISAAGGETRDVILSGRTLYLDGNWNTLCLPFNVNYLTSTPLEGFTVKELDTETAYNGHVTGLDGTTLYLNFKDASSIKAGKPYIVKNTIAASAIGRTATSGTAGYKDSEGYASLVDGNSGTKWCSNKTHSDGNPWVCQFTTASPVNVTGYTLTTGNDTGSNTDRNPQIWTLEAKANYGDAWMTIDRRDVTANASDALPTVSTTESQIYAIDAEKQGKYQYFRFTVSQSGGDLMQLAELTLQGTAAGTIVNPVFTGVTINASEPAAVTSEDGKLSFVGNYSPVALTPNDKSNLFLGAANTLYYPNAANNTDGNYYVNACRAYFHVDLATANLARAFVLNFGDDEATGIENVQSSKLNVQSSAWYDLSGRRLNGKPTAKGLYIHGGRKVIVK